MPKLENEPRLAGENAALVEWARRVTGAVNPLIDSVAALQGYAAGPAFALHLSADQTLASGGTFTFVQFNTVDFDTAGIFSSGNFGVVANVAGFYQINVNVVGNWSAAPTDFRAQIWKNGASVAYHLEAPGAIAGFSTISMSALVPLAAGDLIQAVAWMNAASGTFKLLSGVGTTTLSGFLARHA